MKISKIIVCILSLLLRAWITASAAVMMYIQMSVLAYAQRGYKASGGEMLPVAMVTVAVWYGVGWLMREWYKGTLAMLQLRREHKEDERSGRSRSRSKKTRNVVR
jgi:uncharacterized membrane protein YcjF (UPF0283 family)